MFETVFSAPPPPEAVRPLSLAMTESGISQECQVLFVDISRAHFHSPARRTIYIDLRAKRRVEGSCGILRKSTCGTRDAPANFASLVMKASGSLEFAIGVCNPCLGKHRTRGSLLFYHGVDFVVKGVGGDLKWCAPELGKELILKVRHLGPRADGCPGYHVDEETSEVRRGRERPTVHRDGGIRVIPPSCWRRVSKREAR